MQPNHILAAVMPLVMTLVVAGVSAAEPTFGGTATQRPNIVLIVADDLGYGSLGCYGGRQIRTPAIDRLAASGIRLTDFHANGPMCSPTRAALMTGRYQQRCAWVDDDELSPPYRVQRRDNSKQRWAWGISAKEVTLAGVLRQAGYRTALVGKWHLGYDEAFHPMNRGFDEFRGFIGGAVDYHTHVATHGLHALDWWRDRQIEDERGYSTDLLTRYATDFITRHADGQFFLCLAHAAPHEPLQGRDASRAAPQPAIYREMIEALDESVGAIIARLDEHEITRNTIVIFCSDNGPQPPQGRPAEGPLRGIKGSLLEGGHRVPCIVSWPGTLPANANCDAAVMTMDLFPTLGRLGGATTPAGHTLDGVDILPLLDGGSALDARVMHWRFVDVWAVREGPWKLLGKLDTPTMLFNLADDLGEKTNLLDMEPQRASALLSLHQRWTTAVGSR